MNSLIKPLFRLMVVTFIFAMLMPVTTTRAGPDCNNPKHAEHPSCTGGGEDGVDYTAGLTNNGSGVAAFVIPAVNVTPDAKEGILRPDPPMALTFVRPTGVEPCDLNSNDLTAQAACAWDAVFAACENFFGPAFPSSFTVPAGNSSFQKPGGVRTILEGIPFDVNGNPTEVSGMDPYSKVNVQLIGEEFDFVAADKQFIPAAGNTSTFIETKFWITGGTVKGVRPKKGCVSGGSADVTFFEPASTASVLEITATATPPE